MGAPKGNKYAVGNNGGRPRLYKSVEEMVAVIDEYFESLEPKKNEETGVVSIGYPTVTGLALYLGFCNKDSIYDYRDRKEFSGPIKRALLKVEMHYETSLNYKNPAGSIFALKNMGWKDRHEVDQTGDIKITVNENLIS